MISEYSEEDDLEWIEKKWTENLSPSDTICLPNIWKIIVTKYEEPDAEIEIIC